MNERTNEWPTSQSLNVRVAVYCHGNTHTDSELRLGDSEPTLLIRSPDGSVRGALIAVIFNHRTFNIAVC